MPGPTVLRAAEDELLHLVELVHPEQALRVHAMGPDLATELGRQARQREGQSPDVDHLVHEHGAHRMLRRRDQVQVLAVDLVHHVLEVREVDDALVGGPAHEERREDRGEALLHHVVQGEGKQRLIQSDEVSEQVDESGARDLAGPLEVGEPEGLEQLAVRPELEVDRPRGPPPGNFHVLRVVLADRDAFVEQVGQPQESVADLPREFLDPKVQRGDLLRQRGRFLAQLVRVLARLLGLGDFLRDLIPTALQRVAFGEGFPPFFVPLNHGVEQLRLVRRVTLGQILPDDLRILPDKPDVEHAATRCEGAYL